MLNFNKLFEGINDSIKKIDGIQKDTLNESVYKDQPVYIDDSYKIYEIKDWEQAKDLGEYTNWDFVISYDAFHDLHRKGQIYIILPRDEDSKDKFCIVTENETSNGYIYDRNNNEIPALKFLHDAEDELTNFYKDITNVKLTYAQKYWGKQAWKLNKLIRSMSNENAYLSWTWVFPDDSTEETVGFDFGTEEEYEELKKDALRIYKKYHKDGLYQPDNDTRYLATKMDREANLEPINIYENLNDEKNTI